MTKTKKQLRAEAVERLKNCVAARFDAESVVIALTSGRHGQSDWSLECDKLIYLLTDDDSTISEDDSTAERGMTNLEWLYEHDGYLNSFAKLMACLRGFATDEFTANEWLRQEHYEPNPDCSAMLYRMYTENMKHEPCSHYEPKDDAVSIMRECAETSHGMGVLRGRLGVECVSGWQMRCLGKLADMVERDYVRRDAIEEVMDNDRALVEENAKLASELEAAKLQIGRSDAPKSVETSENPASKCEISDFDVWNVAYEIYCAGGYVDNGNEPNPPTDGIRELLDRQAAITERETTKRHEIFCETCEAESDKQIAELKAERDKLEELNGYHAAQYELASEDCDRLQAQVDKLTAELEKATNNLNSANEDFENARAGLTTERDELKGQVFTLKCECEDLENELHKLTAERDELQAQADEKWNLYVAEHRRADINATDREMYREATSALVDSITDGLRKVNSILDGKDEGLA